jgi:hypothetical protein
VYEHTFVLLCEPVVPVLSIVLILLIIAVAAAPLMSALPSKAQRYEARIRGYASQCGITIKLEPSPEIPARFGYRASSHVVAYKKRRSESCLACVEPKLAVRVNGVWASIPLEQPINQCFETLPEGVQIMELAEYYVSVYWNEKGGEDAVSAVDETLTQMLVVSGFE